MRSLNVSPPEIGSRQSHLVNSAAATARFEQEISFRVRPSVPERNLQGISAGRVGLINCPHVVDLDETAGEASFPVLPPLESLELDEIPDDPPSPGEAAIRNPGVDASAIHSSRALAMVPGRGIG